MIRHRHATADGLSTLSGDRYCTIARYHGRSIPTAAAHPRRRRCCSHWRRTSPRPYTHSSNCSLSCLSTSAGRRFLLHRNRAGDPVGPLALLLIVDERVLAAAAHALDHFRVDAVQNSVKSPMCRWTCCRAGPSRCWASASMSATCTSRWPRTDRTRYSSSRPHEAHQQLRDVVHQRRIGHAEPRVKRVLGQPGKEAANRRCATVLMHRALPPRAPLHKGSKSVQQSPRWGPARRSQLIRLRPPHSVPIRVGLGDRRRCGIAGDPLNSTLAFESGSNFWRRLFHLFLYRTAQPLQPTDFSRLRRSIGDAGDLPRPSTLETFACRRR